MDPKPVHNICARDREQKKAAQRKKQTSEQSVRVELQKIIWRFLFHVLLSSSKRNRNFFKTSFVWIKYFLTITVCARDMLKSFFALVCSFVCCVCAWLVCYCFLVSLVLIFFLWAPRHTHANLIFLTVGAIQMVQI